jgi:pimeloyl-ACP methyl ester carboxylesterase
MTTTRTIELGRDRSLHVAVAGDGPDLVLVHGALGTMHDWLSGPFDRLARDFRVIAVDRPGHGKSRRPRFDGTPREQARQIREGLAELGVRRPILVGHSFGALVTLAYAEQFGDEVAHLVLLAPICFPEPRLVEHSVLAPRAAPIFGPLLSDAAERSVDPAFLRIVQQLEFAPDAVPEPWLETFPYDDVLDPAAMVAEGEDTAAILPGSIAGYLNMLGIRTPTDIVLGREDKIVEHERQGRLLARIMPHARVHELPGVGHMPHHSRPDMLVELLQEAMAEA